MKNNNSKTKQKTKNKNKNLTKKHILVGIFGILIGLILGASISIYSLYYVSDDEMLYCYEEYTSQVEEGGIYQSSKELAFAQNGDYFLKTSDHYSQFNYTEKTDFYYNSKDGNFYYKVLKNSSNKKILPQGNECKYNNAIDKINETIPTLKKVYEVKQELDCKIIKRNESLFVPPKIDESCINIYSNS